MARYVVGVSGASGTIMAYRLIRVLGEMGHEIELVMSQGALYTAVKEMGPEFSSTKKFVAKLPENCEERIQLHPNLDVGAPICSGSYPTDGMVIIPCSMASVAAIAHGLGDNCLRRAADVTLKERRPLVIVPRETPLSEIHLENLCKLSKRGAAIVPPIPAWYHGQQTLEDVENFTVGKVLDMLKIEHEQYAPWLG